jgi:aminoglycoside 6'-N-acetyltransferase
MLTLRPLAEADAGELRRILATPEVSRGIDLFLDPAVHGRGIGTEVVRRVVRMLVDERGHHRVTIDPAASNVAAIRAYEKAGFRRVGVMRSYERDADGSGWHDGLLMELVVA